jgi:F-type H+-transporting ATPase subunit epsilon
MNEMTFHLTIVSPEKILYEGDAEAVTLPGSAGSFTVLAHHAPIVATLQSGNIVYTVGGDAHTLPVKRGFMEMCDGKVSVCVS